jgi:GNAT superfamily N-acetyltransferase
MHSEIRPATARDARILAELRYEFRSAITPARESASDFIARCERWMKERLPSNHAENHEKHWWAWLAHHNTVPCGTVWLHRFDKLPNPVEEREAHGYITSLFVKPEARGAGVGTALLGAALSVCESAGLDSVILWPTPLSRSLYQRHGFAPRDDVLLRVLEGPHRGA